ncbi:choline/ethanolamine kinase isoform X3 [Pieris napi]|uniref:choline/ethanolamine kinase isoform X3 n=1 Tax=Pieris napi TaxID=78633 RepID=UPI001FB916A4|nr:choline/ethanolamine kinase isoform X3 [Pieris napi]
MRSAGTDGVGSSSSSEGAWPRVGGRRPLPSESLTSSTIDTATSTSRPSLTSSISRFRSDFEQLKCKARIFGESMNLCRCIADDYNKRLGFMEKRLINLEQRQRLTGESNYSAIIQKNQKLSHKTKQDVKKLQMCGSEEEMREVAGRICRNYLHGAWKTVDPRDLDFKRISGGLSNFLYYVALPDSRATYRDAPQDRIKTLSEHSFLLDEPKKVLLRIYGQVHGERAMDAIVTESVIFTLLSERRLGPKLHGVFSGGRIEAYIPARSLLTKELSEPALSMKIAEKMAAIHSMEVPLSKEPNWLWKTMSKWLRTAREERFTVHDLKGEERKIMERLRSVDWDAEIEWVRKLTNTVNSPVVFCHNDMQEGNVLLVEEETSAEEEEGALVQTYPLEDSSDSVSSSLSDIGEPRLMLIDFEYCAYNHRAFDIANHFQEWSYDYSNSQHPFYFEFLDQEPTLEQKPGMRREDPAPRPP